MNSTNITTGMEAKGTLRGSDRGSGVSGPTAGESTVNSPKRLAKIAGVLYLLVGIFGGFAEGFVDPKMYVAGNAAITAGNVVANSGLVCMGVVAHLLDGIIFLFLAMVLYLLLKHVNKSAASAMVVLVALATGIICLNAVFEFEGLRVATGAVNLAAFGTAGSNALVLLLLDTQHYGTLIARGVCYLVDLLALFLVPDFGQQIHLFVGVIPTTIAEVSMVIYLLVIGVKTVKTSRLENRILAAE